jgi:biopolymer transport protein TolQ
MNDIPVVAMIIRSGWVARIILLLLALLSVLTWAIVLNRWLVLKKNRGLNKSFKKLFESIKSVADLEKIDEKVAKGPLGILGRLAAAEFKRILSDAHSDTGLKDWSFYLESQFTMVSDRLSSAISTMEERFHQGLVLLAMSSSIGPFLGLLGTVWGIMDSFYEIGEQGSASLPVVAPGIAESLITTIVGLVVAIPALFFYNIFVNRAANVTNEMDAYSEQISLRLKREIFALLYRSKRI